MSFSCLISCYKNDDHKLLVKCLDSIVNQTYKPNEVVFVKDGKIVGTKDYFEDDYEVEI